MITQLRKINLAEHCARHCGDDIYLRVCNVRLALAHKQRAYLLGGKAAVGAVFERNKDCDSLAALLVGLADNSAVLHAVKAQNDLLHA